jgi:hypothetical protein
MLMACAGCGQPVTPAAVVCGFCGREMWGVCPGCGGPFRAGAQWCGTCGSEVVAPLRVPAGGPAALPPAPSGQLAQNPWAAPATGPGPALPGTGFVGVRGRTSSRRPLFIGATLLLAVAVAVVGGALVLGGALTSHVPPGAGAGSPGATAAPFSDAHMPQPVSLTRLGSTPVAADGSPVTDAHGVSVAIAAGSLANASTVQLATSDLPASFDSSLTSERGLRRTSPVYSLELDKGSDVRGTVPLSFPAASPDDRVAVLLDQRFFIVLGVEPANGRLTVQAAAESGTDPAFPGEGAHYFVVAKASTAQALARFALARMPLGVSQEPRQTGSGTEAAPSGELDCDEAIFLHQTTCWNPSKSISLTMCWSWAGPEHMPGLGGSPSDRVFVDRVAAIMKTYNMDLVFNSRVPSAADPIHLVIDDVEPADSTATPSDPRYRPNLIADPTIYLDIATMIDIDQPAVQQTVAHELFHWIQHGTYYMIGVAKIPQVYWNFEVRAEAASFLLSQAYQPARLLKVGAMRQSGDTSGALGWQALPLDWSMMGADPWRYVDGQVFRLGLCDDPAACAETVAGLVAETTQGRFSVSRDDYRKPLASTAQYLLGVQPATGVQVDLSAPIIQTGRGIGDYIHAGLTTVSNSPMSYVSMSSTSAAEENLEKNLAVPGKVAIHATIQSGGVYPLRASNGADVPLDQGFGGKARTPDAPYALHLDPGVDYYYRVGTGPIRRGDRAKPLDISPITSEASVEVRQADGSWALTPGIPSVRIVAINQTFDPVTLNGSMTPLAPKMVATPTAVANLDPTKEVELRIDMSQVTRNTQRSDKQAWFTANWDFGDGSPVEPKRVDFPLDTMKASTSAMHTFRTAAKGVTVTFADSTGQPLAWDAVIIPVSGSATTPSTAATGHWVLTATEPNGGPADDFPGEKNTFDLTNGRITMSFDWNDPGDRPAHQEGSISWGPPPASAAPGQTWTSTLLASLTCSGNVDSWKLEPLGLGVTAPGLEVAGNGNKGSEGVRATCTNASASTELSWAFPTDGYPGRTFNIVVRGGGSSGGGGWTYQYEWRQ